MTSERTLRPRLLRVDEAILDDHTYLENDDPCYYLREYTSRLGYGYSETNSIISNIKKQMSRRHFPDWRYKCRDILRCARELRTAVGDNLLANITFVPIPPSDAKDDPAYDPRMTQMLRALGEGVDVRELLVQRQSVTPSHLSERRPTPNEIEANYLPDIAPALLAPVPRLIALVDDVLTTGAHFIAGKRFLANRFSGVQVVGIFIARRVFPPEEEL